jgi:hypothetical protein
MSDRDHYRVNYADGRKARFDSIEEVEKAIKAEYPSAVFADNGDASEAIRVGELFDAGRILVWANLDDSENDAGYRAVAEIV